MSDSKQSERAIRWMQNNPEKHKANIDAAKERKKRRQEESIAALDKSRYKSPEKAIRHFCNLCPYGTSRSGYDLAPVDCSKTDCPLFAFRNGNPVRIKLHKELNNVRKGK
jgi:hypothetical protein